MKASLLAYVVSMLPAASALAISRRADLDANNLTDELVFDISLEDFIKRRKNNDPASLDWDTDGCSHVPDLPLNFNFRWACWRHDFGYTNYHNQHRFTKAAKAAIDRNFRKDLHYQCTKETPEWMCYILADTYYAGVKVFGGRDARKRSLPEGMAEYEELLAIYSQVMAVAKEKGIIPSDKI
ncbi:hypothetical protein VPNG_02199 [Cytospora leucostoma]|uniref:Phospholipase A2 n=1 Tax=Cytospora leucostoma TaxID=1230097 RepID=A0A423XHX0_9PEZI|nr:hypothetical protein VPNG_02199 [Cytospora leucostoma]